MLYAGYSTAKGNIQWGQNNKSRTMFPVLLKSVYNIGHCLAFNPTIAAICSSTAEADVHKEIIICFLFQPRM